jgi:voltage-gated potassium channel
MDAAALRTYERLTGPPLAALGLVFLVVYAWPILQPDLPRAAALACTTIGTVIWVVMALDYAVRFSMAKDRLRFVRHNWFDLLIIALPMLRPLRSLRSLLALRIIARGGLTFTRQRVVATVGVTVAAGGAVAALAMLDAERTSSKANINTYGDALWWALSTITTVGYGDRYPTTAEGRLIAAALMLAGIALLGVVTASLASWFVEHIGDVAKTEQRTQVALEALTGEVEALRRAVEAARISQSNHLTDQATVHQVPRPGWDDRRPTPLPLSSTGAPAPSAPSAGSAPGRLVASIEPEAALGGRGRGVDDRVG